MRDYLIYSTIVGIVLALAVLLRLAVKRMAKRKECLCDSCQHLSYRNRGVFSNTYRCPEDDGYRLYSHKNLDFCIRYVSRIGKPATVPEPKRTTDDFLNDNDYAQALRNAAVQRANRVICEQMTDSAPLRWVEVTDK